MKNKWKAGFILLLGINVAIIALLAFLILSPTDDDPVPKQTAGKETVDFQVQSNKEDLNKVVKTYIDKEKKNSPVDYNVYLRDKVELYGEVPVFSEKIDYKLTFEPKALENGNIVLKQDGIKVGKIKLPVSYVLKAARDSYNFPDWVQIMPNDELIYVSLDKLELKSDVKIRADKVELAKDDIQFTLMVPMNE